MEITVIDFVVVYVAFALLALAAKEVGKGVKWLGLPLLSGFLVTGIVAGPHVLAFLPLPAVHHLRFVSECALAFIALAAGAELDLQTIRGYLHRIVAIIVGLTGAVFVLGALAYFLLADFIPFMGDMSTRSVIGVALLGGTIMVARSPSSAYAVVKELRAHGPFTQVILGVTVLMDAVVIILFAINVSCADILIQGARFDGEILFLLLAEILLDILFGVMVAQVLRGILALPCRSYYKTGLILLTGYGIFYLASALYHIHLGPMQIGIFSEPLLIGLVAGFMVANSTRHTTEFRTLLEEIAPVVFLGFFTLVGMSFELEVIAHTWGIALVLLLVRMAGIYLGCVVGGAVLGNPARQHIFFSMTFITQAGVSVGLAEEVAVAFPGWGQEFATLAIAVVMMNQLIGPPFFKWALYLVGEAHPRAEPYEFDGMREVIIFGVDNQSLALARQLKAHRWGVKLADIEAGRIERLVWPGVETHVLTSLSVQALQALDIERTDTIIAMLDDESNYRICELAYEEFGTAHLVARLYDRQNLERFRALGVVTVDPSTAMINLLDHYVRSPSATALLLGQETNQDVIEVTVRNHALHGTALRDLPLPGNTLILSIRRHGRLLLSHGYTRLELGDEVTVVGQPDSLEEVQWYFEPYV
jgi:Trk K+ transport system NAD-binding subunit/Kef-type K+ transport system membrane component KefB